MIEVITSPLLSPSEKLVLLCLRLHRHDPQMLIHPHRKYLPGNHTVAEVAQLLNLHEHTVRAAVRGLKAKGYFS